MTNPTDNDRPSVLTVNGVFNLSVAVVNADRQVIVRTVPSPPLDPDIKAVLIHMAEETGLEALGVQTVDDLFNFSIVFYTDEEGDGYTTFLPTCYLASLLEADNLTELLKETPYLPDGDCAIAEANLWIKDLIMSGGYPSGGMMGKVKPEFDAEEDQAWQEFLDNQ